MVIKNKKLNIVIFGFTSSIGNFLSRKYYLNNHNLLLFSNNKQKFNKLKKNYSNNQTQEIIFERFDITNTKKTKSIIKKNIKFFKKADLIISTIGVQGEINNFFNSNLKKFKKTFDINFFSHVYLLKYLYKTIQDNKRTLIILFSGGGATSKRENFSSYSLSKIALVKLVEILSTEIKTKNIRINAIAPGIIDSKMTRIILKNKNKVEHKEILKIKKAFKSSNKSLNKVYDLINLLLFKSGKNISGKILSSRWDNFKKWNEIELRKISSSDIFTMRRRQNF